MGRTGTLWRCDAEGIVPDIMTFGKAFGGGVMPITGLIFRPEMWSEELVENPYLLGSTTFGGNPVCCAAAIAALDFQLKNDVPGQAREKGAKIKCACFVQGAAAKMRAMRSPPIPAMTTVSTSSARTSARPSQRRNKIVPTP